MNFHRTKAQFVCDAVKPTRDPTGTMDLRRRYVTLISVRWRMFIREVKSLLVEQDMLGLQPGKATVLGLSLAGLSTEARTRAFQLWLDQALARVVLEYDTAYLDPMIDITYRRAMKRAQRLTRTDVVADDMRDVISNLQQLALMEMQGIVEAVSQRVVRLAANAQLDKETPRDLMKEIQLAVSQVGMTRSRTMVNVMVIKSHSQATLDTFEAAGLTHVALLPETVPSRRRSFGDAVEPAQRRRGTSSRTVGRIRSEEQQVEEALGPTLVEVQTAEDDLVCPECEEISADGPYTIDEARGLIPAHPNCRCTFMPEGDLSEVFGGVFG